MRAIYQSPIGAIALKSTFNRFKFPFSQNSRFELKREIVAKGNLKAKTGKMPTQRVAKQKREFKSQNGKNAHPAGCEAKKGI